MLAESRKLDNFAHGYTYWAHPVAAAVALEVQRIYEEMDLLGHVGRVGAHMQHALRPLADHRMVGDVRGVGLLAGLDIVADKETRAMFDPALRVPAIIERNFKKHALILRVIGNRIALSPPVIITESEVDELVSRLCDALDDALDEIERLGRPNRSRFSSYSRRRSGGRPYPLDRSSDALRSL